MTEKRFRAVVCVNDWYIEDKEISPFAVLTPHQSSDLLNTLYNENERLKKQLGSIDRLIDNKIDEFKNGDYGDLPCNTIHMFLDLKQEIGVLE